MPQSIERSTDIHRHKTQATIPVDSVTGIDVSPECIQCPLAVVHALQGCATCIASDP